MGEKRVIETSVTSIFLAGAVFFLSGAAAAWLVFGVEWGISFGDGSGSRADWVAAFGTWIIGYGAWKIARESHLQRLREAELEEAREEKSHLSRIAWFSGQTTTARSAFIVLLEATEKAESIQAFRVSVRVTSSVIRGLTAFDADSTSLSVDSVDRLDFLGLDVRRFLHMGDSFMAAEITEKNAEEWLRTATAGFADVARSAVVHCDSFLAELVKLSVRRS